MEELLEQYGELFSVALFGGWILWMLQLALEMVGG